MFQSTLVFKETTFDRFGLPAEGTFIFVSLVTPTMCAGWVLMIMVQ